MQISKSCFVALIVFQLSAISFGDELMDIEIRRFFMNGANSTSASQNDPLADEVNRRDQRGHYIFEGTWIPEPAYDGIESITVTPRSSSEGKTSAVIELKGNTFNHVGWTSDAFSVDSIDSLHISNLWSTQHKRDYVARIRYGSGSFDAKDTLYVTAHTEYVELTTNKKTPDRMQLTLRVYPASSASFPEIDYSATAYRSTPVSGRIIYKGVATLIQGPPTSHTVLLRRR